MRTAGWQVLQLTTGLGAVLVAAWIADRRRKLLAVLLTLAGCATLLNWSVLEPRTYFAVHRWTFDAVARGVRDGSLSVSDDLYGSPMPWQFQMVSATADASVNGLVVGRVSAATPRLFIPETMDGLNGADGYLLVDGLPGADDVVGVFGDLLHPARGTSLGGGWWYVRDGDG